MNKKIVFIGSLILLLAFGLVFTGCNNEGPAAYFEAIDAPVVTTTKVGSTNWVIKWTAVSDAADYSVGFQPTGEATINWLPAKAQNAKIYTINGTTITENPNLDADAWSTNATISRSGQNGAQKGKVVVVAVPINSDKNPGIGYSDEITITD